MTLLQRRRLCVIFCATLIATQATQKKANAKSSILLDNGKQSTYALQRFRTRSLTLPPTVFALHPASTSIVPHDLPCNDCQDGQCDAQVQCDALLQHKCRHSNAYHLALPLPGRAISVPTNDVSKDCHGDQLWILLKTSDSHTSAPLLPLNLYSTVLAPNTSSKIFPTRCTTNRQNLQFVTLVPSTL